MSPLPPDETGRDPGEEPDPSPSTYPIGTTGMGIPDEALAAGETLEDELVSDEGDGRLVRLWRSPGAARP